MEAKLPFNLVKHKLLFPLVEDFPPPLAALKMFLMHYYIAYIRMVNHEFLCQESVTFGQWRAVTFITRPSDPPLERK